MEWTAGNCEAVGKIPSGLYIVKIHSDNVIISKKNLKRIIISYLRTIINQLTVFNN